MYLTRCPVFHNEHFYLKMKQICIDNINQLSELFFQTSEVGRGENAKGIWISNEANHPGESKETWRVWTWDEDASDYGYPPEANTQATYLNVHATSDLQYPIHPYISPSSVYESHSSISGDSSYHSSSYFEL